MTLPLLLDAEAVVLDLDGLLIDSETACFETANEILSRFGHRLASEEFTAFVGRSVENLYAWLAHSFALPTTIDYLIAQRYPIIASRYASPVLMPGAAELVNRLAFDGLPVAIASSSPTPLVLAALDGAGLRGLIQEVVADGHPDVTRLKPAPDLYLVACRLLGVDPGDACAVEDSAAGATAALAAGLTTVIVPSEWTRGSAFPSAALSAASLTDISFRFPPR